MWTPSRTRSAPPLMVVAPQERAGPFRRARRWDPSGRVRIVATSLAPEDVQGGADQGDRPDGPERPPQRPLAVGNEPAADERDPDPVQAVIQDPQDEQHVEREEDPARGEPDEVVP